MYRLAAASFTTVVGLVAAALLCTRFDFPFLAARAYIDIPYLALVVWAVALEAEHRRRGTLVFVLLAAAGLLRPEAWLLSGLYWLWCILPRTWPQRIGYAALTAVGPIVWAAVDWIVTGDPLFSLTHTTGLAEELGRSSGAVGDPGRDCRVPQEPRQGRRCSTRGSSAWCSRSCSSPRRVVWPLGLFVDRDGDVRARRRSPACR